MTISTLYDKQIVKVLFRTPCYVILRLNYKMDGETSNLSITSKIVARLIGSQEEKRIGGG